MFDMLLNASVTGAIVILLWCLFYPLSKKYFKASWHYTVLKIAMVFMIFPVSVFSPMLNNMFSGLFTKQDSPRISEQIQAITINTETINSVNSALSGFVFNDVQDFPPFPETDDGIEAPDDADSIDDINITRPNIPYLQVIWLTVAVILLSDGFRKMHRFKRQILNSSDSNIDHETQELFLQCKKQIKVYGKVNLRTSKYIKTPLVLGTIRPLVVFPETDMSADEKRLAFIHELTHIKNGDLWVKFFASVISAVHWFNPFAYLLRSKLSVISEEYCDECVIRTIEKEERLLYCNLILKVVSDIAAPQAKFCSPLSAPAKNMKRRLSNMLNSKKSRKSMIALSVIIAIMISSFATVYAFAASSDTANESSEPQEKTYNENFYNELEEMYKYLVSEGEFAGTFEDFKDEVHAKKAALDNLMKYAAENVNPAQLLTDGMSIADLESFFENDFQTDKDINLEEMLEKIKAKNPDISSKLEELKKKCLEQDMFIAELLDGDLIISELEQKLKDKYDPHGTINFTLPINENKIILAKSIIVETPEDTIITIIFIEKNDTEIKITIGNGIATITYPDGTSSSVHAGTVLDGEGNVIG